MDASTLQWAYRAQKSLGVKAGVPNFPDVHGFDGAHVGSRMLVYSASGSRLAVALEQGTQIYDVHDTGVELRLEVCLSLIHISEPTRPY